MTMQIWKGKYFIDNREVSEQDAAIEWFRYADDRGIDVARAISLWEDAATPGGAKSRDEIGACGIRIQPPEHR